MEKATEIINCTVEVVRQQAKEAEEKFDQASSAVIRKAKTSMNLFQSSTLARVSEIASDSKDACDELYSTYQALVLMLDKKCRPLLAEKPDDNAIYQVADLIKWLNKESEIENNFSSSLNGYNLGEMVKAKYFPSMEAKTIQKFWESEYAMTSTAVNNARRENAQKQKLQQQNKDRLESSKSEYEQAVKDYELKLTEYKNLHAEWEEAIHNIENKISSQAEQTFSGQRGERISSETQSYQSEKSKAEQEKSDLNGELESLREVRAGLNFLQIRKKKEIESNIQNLGAKLQNLEKNMALLDSDHHNKIKEINQDFYLKQNELIRKLYNEIQLPKEPLEPEKPKPSREVALSLMSPSQRKNEGYKDEICDYMESGRNYTAEEINEEILYEYSLTRVRMSSLLRQLEEEKRITCHFINGSKYYRIVHND